MIAGGGFLQNSTASGKICSQTGFKKLHVYAAPVDDGTDQEPSPGNSILGGDSRGINLTIEQTTEIIARTARRDPPSGILWDNQYGYGRISASAAVQAVIEMDSNSRT